MRYKRGLIYLTIILIYKELTKTIIKIYLDLTSKMQSFFKCNKYGN